MENLADRALFLLIGALLGFVLGYVVRLLQDIKKEVHLVEEHVSHIDNRDEGGYMRIPQWATIKAYLLTLPWKVIGVVIGLLFIAYGTFSTQATNNKVQENQDGLTNITVSLQNVTFCNQMVLSDTVKALNERTTYSQQQAEANVELQKAQLQLFQSSIVKPPPTQAAGDAAVKKYLDALTTFVTVSGKSANKVATNPYPSKTALLDCLKEENEKGTKP